jgi:methionyl-tRNA formyltransferase
LNWSIIRGEKKTGITIMLMDEGMDSGDILAQEETPLGDEETYGQLHDRLAKDGAALLMKTISQVISSKAHRRQQDTSGVTFAPRLTRETGNINWQESAVHIVNLIRGLCPSPAAYTFWEGQLLKIYTAAAQTGPVDQAPGTIGTAVADGLSVAASDGRVILKDIQLAGKKRMLMNDFLRGYRPLPGSILCSTRSG